jgi:hypothetical protein
MNHENYFRAEPVEGSSCRSFGLVFTALFVVLALLPLVSGASPRYWSMVAASVLLLISILAPTLLAWPNKGWTLFAALLHKVVNPIVLAVLFFLIITPYGIIMRLFRKDQLALEREPTADSYWQKRMGNLQNMKRQF